MYDVAMQTAEPASTREATKIMAKMIDIAYAKSDLEEVASNAVQLKSDGIFKLISLLNKFEGTLGECETEHVGIELKPYLKLVNIKYCMVPGIKSIPFV